MWIFKKKNKQRRLDVRKKIPTEPPRFWKRFRDEGGLGSLPIAFVFTVVIILLDVIPLNPMPYREGQYIPSDIHARVGFQVLSPKLLELQVQRAIEDTPAIFDADEDRIDQLLLPLKAIPGQISAATQPKDIQGNLKQKFALREQDIEEWKKFSDEDGSKELQAQLDRLKQKLLETCIVSSDDAAVQIERLGNEIVLNHNSTSSEIQKGALISLSDEGRIKGAVTGISSVMSPGLRYNTSAWLGTQLAKSPLYIYDAANTEIAKQKAEDAVREHPPIEAYDIYSPGEVIVSRYKKTQSKALDESEFELLQAEHGKWLEQQSTFQKISEIAGRSLLILLICVGIFVYIFNSQSRIVSNHWRAVALAILFSSFIFAGKVLVQFSGTHPNSSVGLILALAMILVITYNRRVSLVLSSAISIIMVLILRGDFTLLIILIGAVMTCVALLDDIRTRSRLIEISALCSLIIFAIVWARSLADAVPAGFTVTQGLWAVGFALLAGFFVQGVLPLIEKVFRVATSMTLLEWCDANKPLLRRLAMEAPGTYNHSLQLGTMCEAAAEAIGARGLLARVGSYYHDIGKINKPEYFIENQGAQPSKHSKLSPAMSLLIIVGHVKDGLAMAREYKVPTVLHEFMATHHGTTLVQYFYHQAAELRKQYDQRAPDELEFRYPGPKPMSKECAILMLADASESSVRSMDNPTPGQIENQVHSMVTRRLMDGQLDDCELTLSEVHKIEQSLIKSLCGIYHSRIAYPTPPGQKPSAAERQKNETKFGDTTAFGIPSGSIKADDKNKDKDKPADQKDKK